MRPMRTWLLAAAAAAALACSDDGTSPGDGGNGGGPAGSITVGNIFFESAHNGTRNPAVDTVAAGTTVTWTWTATGAERHSVLSQGTPGFASSDILTGDGQTYAVTFATPGTYQYDCAVHGSLMTGRIVVQ
ncbi:MAG TPA: plastocyanin/azurin family copper-binding protein [Gemmatimonadales bacterium]|nr:plastocyanin/azurin family copper-binding protein [Gemmatimonadales bacterium]